MEQQVKIIKLAKEIFKDCKLLGNAEQEALNKAYKRSLKSKPTRKNRR